MDILDLKEVGVRGVNSVLNDLGLSINKSYRIDNPMGQHAIACGLDAQMQVQSEGHVGFYCGGMNQQAEIMIKGHAGVGVAEHMMSCPLYTSPSPRDQRGTRMPSSA